MSSANSRCGWSLFKNSLLFCFKNFDIPAVLCGFSQDAKRVAFEGIMWPKDDNAIKKKTQRPMIDIIREDRSEYAELIDFVV